MSSPEQMVQARLAPGESVSAKPVHELFLCPERLFIAKLVFPDRSVSVWTCYYRDITDVRVQAGTEIRAKNKTYRIEVASGGVAGGKPPASAPEFRLSNGMSNSMAAGNAFAARPNVFHCGTGPEGAATAERVSRLLSARRHSASSTVTDHKTCPRCAEQVKAAALVCRYCSHEFR